MVCEEGIDHRAGRLEGLFPGDKRASAAMASPSSSSSLIADELLACTLDARGEGDRGVRPNAMR